MTRSDTHGRNIPRRWITVKEVAEYLSISEKQVYQKALAGDLPGSRVAGDWRFDIHQVDDWLASGIDSDAFLLAANQLLSRWAIAEPFPPTSTHHPVAVLESHLTELMAHIVPNPINLLSFQYLSALDGTQAPQARDIGRDATSIPSDIAARYTGAPYAFLNWVDEEDGSAEWISRPIRIHVAIDKEELSSTRRLRDDVVSVLYADLRVAYESFAPSQLGNSDTIGSRSDSKFGLLPATKLLSSHVTFGKECLPNGPDKLVHDLRARVLLVLLANTHYTRHMIETVGRKEWNLVLVPVAQGRVPIGGYVMHSERPLSAKSQALFELAIGHLYYLVRAQQLSTARLS